MTHTTKTDDEAYMGLVFPAQDFYSINELLKIMIGKHSKWIKQVNVRYKFLLQIV